MRNLTTTELREILDKHLGWLRGEIGGERANLTEANLTRANLTEADLSWADLTRANLSWASLSEANLTWANLSEADLTRANLSEADLTRANLSWANLTRANLSEANLTWANLSEADLTRANLSWANLSWANLSEANLSEADLTAPPMLLLANWLAAPPELITELMRYDAANHPDPNAFDEWAKTGKCPYSGTKWQRSANFPEDKSLWIPGPSKSALELVLELFKANGVKR
jgi:hypothetical protein